MSDITLRTEPMTAEAIRKEEYRANNLKFATWLFLASEVVLFTMMIAGYILFRINEPEIVSRAHEGLSIILISANTFVLLASSWAMVMGLRDVKMDNLKGGFRWFMLTAGLGVLFLFGQYYEYMELAHLSVTLGVDTDALAGWGMRFYAPTFFHGAHVFVGVIWALLVARRTRRGDYNRYRTAGIEMFGLYWHFVDVAWIFLFTLIYLV
jgi:heme/copper-type cytochrome/quinol oxidase subunit 3